MAAWRSSLASRLIQEAYLAGPTVLIAFAVPVLLLSTLSTIVNSVLNRTAMAHLQPLHVNPATNEPYLRLPSPLDKIIITPPRLTDAHRLVEIFSDPRVYTQLEAPPFPYRLSDADSWLEHITKEADVSLREIKEAWDNRKSSDDDASLPFVGTCPVRYVREVMDDGTDVLLGEIALHRCEYPDKKRDLAERASAIQANADLTIGDPAIAWCMGGMWAPYLSHAPPKRRSSWVHHHNKLTTTKHRLYCRLAPWSRYHVRSLEDDHARVDDSPVGCAIYTHRGLYRKYWQRTRV